MTLSGQIIELLRRTPGLTDREITNLLRGDHAPQQPINHTCRNLEHQGRVRRQKRSDGKLGNFVTDFVPQLEHPTIKEALGPMISGQIVCSDLNFNSLEFLSTFLEVVTLLFRDSDRWHDLAVHRSFYFKTPTNDLPREPGWYIVCDKGNIPLYVGKAKDLNKRLNTTNGSLDNFAHSRRKQDPIRNFIKAFVSNGLLGQLRVGILTERELALRLAVSIPLRDLDRSNIEKVIEVFRCRVVEHAM